MNSVCTRKNTPCLTEKLSVHKLLLLAGFATGAFEPPPGRWERGYEVGAVAVALADGRGFADPFLSETGPSAAVGPLLPFLWSLLIRAFGAQSAAAWAGFVLLNMLFSALVVPALHALGLRCGGAALGFVAALAWTLHPVGVVAPFEYTALIWSTLIGFLVWGDWPVTSIWIGAGVIAASGLYLVHREG